MAGQLDGQYVVPLRVQDDLHDRPADVADRCGSQPGSRENRLKHLGRCRLAIGAGDSQPWHDLVRAAQPPGQLNFAPDRYASISSLAQQRRRGRPAGGDHQIGIVWKSCGGTWTEPHRATENFKQFSLVGSLVVQNVVQYRDPGAELEQSIRGRETRYPDPRYHDVGLLPG